MERKKACIVIPSFCDSEIKQNILLDNIKKIKENCNLDILLSSNRIKLDKTLYDNVNYYIYDETNSISEKPLVTWVKSHGHVLIREYYDYGYSVMRHLKLASDFLLNSNYTHMIFVTYDIVLNDIVFNEINRFLDGNYKNIALTYVSGMSFNSFNPNEILPNKSINPFLFMFDIKKFVESFKITMEEYVNKYQMFENYLYDIFNVNEVENSDIFIDSVVDSRQITDNILDFKNFTIFPHKNKDNKINLFIYNMKDVFNFTLNIKFSDNIVMKLDITKNMFNKFENLLYADIETNMLLTDLIIEYNGVSKKSYDITNYIIIKL
jgi:hypothetical protein